MLTTFASLAVASKSTVGLHANMLFVTGDVRVLELKSSSSCSGSISVILVSSTRNAAVADFRGIQESL